MKESLVEIAVRKAEGVSKRKQVGWPWAL